MRAIKNNAPVKPSKAIDKSVKHTQKQYSCSNYYNIFLELEQEERNVMGEKNKKFLTVREVAATGILTEYAIRLLLRQKKIPVIYINRKALINYPLLLESLDKQSIQQVRTEGESD